MDISLFPFLVWIHGWVKYQLSQDIESFEDMLKNGIAERACWKTWWEYRIKHLIWECLESINPPSELDFSPSWEKNAWIRFLSTVLCIKNSYEFLIATFKAQINIRRLSHKVDRKWKADFGVMIIFNVSFGGATVSCNRVLWKSFHWIDISRAVTLIC